MGRTGLEGVTCGRSRGSERLLLTRSRTHAHAHTHHTRSHAFTPPRNLCKRGGGRTGSVPSGSRKGRRGLCADGSPAAGPCGARPPPPRAPEPSPGAGGDAGLSSPAPPATPSSRAPPGGSWQASGEQALAALAQARPGPILFPLPLRNALTRRLLKKSCRKSILSRDCPQTRLDFY